MLACLIFVQYQTRIFIRLTLLAATAALNLQQTRRRAVTAAGGHRVGPVEERDFIGLTLLAATATCRLGVAPFVSAEV